MEVVLLDHGIAVTGTILNDACNKHGLDPGIEGVHSPLHISLLSREEFEACGKPPLPSLTPEGLDPSYLHVLGIGSSPITPCDRWMVVVWYHLEKWRKSLGLASKTIYIPITADRGGDSDKGLTTLSDEHTARLHNTATEDELDHVLLTEPTDLHPSLAQSMATRFPTSYKAFVRLGDLQRRSNVKLSMLAYARALRINPGLESYVRKQLSKLNGLVAWGATVTDANLETIPELLRPSLLDPKNFITIDFLRTSIWTSVQEPRERVLSGTYRLPRFFTWLLPNRLAGMSTPLCEQDIDELQRLGITTVLTLTKEEPLSAHWFSFKRIKNIYIPIDNYKAPSIEEMDCIYNRFLSDDRQTWIVHCGGGKGRAGTVLACILSMLSNDGEFTPTPCRDKSSAISLIRNLRPGSIETIHQETFIGTWINHRWAISHTAPSSPEPTTPLTLTHTPTFNPAHAATSVSHIVLTGLPGSGKTWLRTALLNRRLASTSTAPRPNTLSTIPISHDESRSRASAESAFSLPHAPPTLIILDACNASRADRAHWLALAQPAGHVVAVHCSADAEVCLDRIKRRIGHETVRVGKGGNAVAHMAARSAAPELGEGFDAVVMVPSFAAAREAVALLGPAVGVAKFPRTPHLVDLGGATGDDVVVGRELAGQEGEAGGVGAIRGRAVVEEKVDGANLGFSLDWDGEIRVQNRSHWVCGRDHRQFGPLEKWVEEKKAVLRELLGRDGTCPERYVLYGEWVVAKHSIHYSRLPDRFLAFDLYDRVEKRFVSRRVLEKALEGTGIRQVPLVKVLDDGGSMTKGDWEALMKTKSQYYDGPVEGVYVRMEDRESRWTTGRGKVVRGDFISGDEHWTRQGCIFNGIERAEEQ